jgi:CheY-like chemotaxis protein
MNLATNARDAMPGGGLLRIETSRVVMDEHYCRIHDWVKPGMYALIAVTDTGAGMDQDTASKIFEPFFTTKEVGKGTGLGLSIAHGIIKQHNGYIDVHSEPRKGTAFKIYLPLVDAPTAQDKPRPHEPAALRGGSETILLAEDDAMLRKLATIVLEGCGYTVIQAVDGRDAVDRFREHRDRIQLVMLDGIMPKMNGKEAWREIRMLDPGIKGIFISGYAEDIFTTEGIPDPEAAFIQKPVSPTVLAGKVRDVLDA